MKVYKLTDADGKTRNDTQWGPGVTHTADGKSTELCNAHWIHAYQDPLLAVFMNPAHGDFKNPKLWECEGEVGLELPDKIGCTSLTTVKEIDLPQVTNEQRVRFALFATLKVYSLWKKYDKDGVWLKWAKARLSGDKTAAIAAAFAAAIDGAAATAAAFAAATAAARLPLLLLSPAAAAAAIAAHAAYDAAAAAKGKTKIDLVALAHKAMEAK